MRLTIFWRTALVQLILTILILPMGFSALLQLRKQSKLTTDTLTTNAAHESERRRLLDLFFVQRSRAEKYLLLRDQAVLEQFIQGNRTFSSVLDRGFSLMNTSEEKALVGQIRSLYARYSDGLAARGALFETWKQERAEISDRIVAALSTLLSLSEARRAAETEASRNKPVSTPAFLGWLLVSGLGLTVAILYLHVRGVSRPLNRLALAVQHVNQGEFHRTLRVHGPSEVADVLDSFNLMVERLANLDEMQDDFLVQMSHELRTLLAAIQEGSALLLEEVPGVLNPSQREIMRVIHQNSERLFYRLVAVLDLSRMEAKKMEYALVPTDLIELVKQSVEAIGPIAQKKKLQMKLFIPTPLPVLYADADRIRQVLENLLSNAVKFTPEKGLIRVSTAVGYDRDSGERWVEVSVSDTGVGVLPEDAERIFHKFYQSSSHRRQWRQGSGLGLAISRCIVEAHGGDIWVESHRGEGASFVFTLPVRRHKDNDHKKEERTPRGGRLPVA
jgi:two-component system, NtrC family, sensor histidine kinase GlrK